MAKAPSRAIMLFGTDEPPAETRLLTAGPLTAELDAGNLRYIRFNGHEAIRAISYVVRDEFWGTFNPEIRNLTVEETDESFSVTYRADCGDAKQRFGYSASITGQADGTLRFSAVGKPETDFLTNRTGFVVLHGVEGVSGEAVEVEEVDGRRIETRFPEVIDPKQPIMNIRSLKHQVAPNLSVTCRMTGDTFEMEDQRNWTDASYKTYVRPLGLPHPFTLKTGEILEQSVELKFEGAAPTKDAAAGTPEITLRIGGLDGNVPRIGMALEWQDTEGAMARLDRLNGLKPAFLSGYFDARFADASAMEGFRAVADRLECDLALELVLPGLEEPESVLKDVAAMALRAGADFAAVAVSPSEDLEFVIPGTVFEDMSAHERLYAAARAAFPASAIGGGSFMYFTEFNRKPPPFGVLDYVTHGTCAIVHAADDRSVTETIECLPWVIRSGRALFGDKPYRLGPVGIGTRTSPFGGTPAANPHSGRVAMCRNDPRHRGLLGSAWQLGVAARAAEGAVDSLVLGAPVGDFGLVHHPGATPQTWFDQAGGFFPAYHVMAGLYCASGLPRRATEVTQPRDLQALAFETDTGLEVWMANLTGVERQVSLEGLGAGPRHLAAIDEESFETCAQDPAALAGLETPISGDRLTLRPYAVVRCRTDR